MTNTTAPTKLEKILYTAHASAVAGREGHVKTDDGVLDLDLRTPKGLGGKGDPGTNPEQLFAAGYAACFGSAVGLVARQKKINAGTVRIDSTVNIGATASGGYGLSVALVLHLPDVPREVAEELVQAAHQVCPYSHATRGNIEVTLSVA